MASLTGVQVTTNHHPGSRQHENVQNQIICNQGSWRESFQMVQQTKYYTGINEALLRLDSVH